MKIKFKDLADGVLGTVSDSIIKAKRNLHVWRLKTDEKLLSMDIKKEYRQLGEKYYKSVKENKDMGGVDQTIDEIDYLNQQLITLKDRIKKEKSMRFCNVCSTYVTANKPFCPKCGSKF